ncbi:MAG: ABC transporter permease [Acidimicrobiales bacterium]
MSRPSGVLAEHPTGPRRSILWLLPSGFGRSSLRLFERNVVAYRAAWTPWLAAMAEPFLYLLSIGVGVGALVGDLPGPGGQPVPYAQFVAPGLLAVAAMNGAAFDTTFGFYVKLKYQHVYDGVLATPMAPADVVGGEVLWSLGRGGVYATAFLVAMVVLGLTASPWAILAVPVALLVGFAFAAAGLAASSFMRSWVDFDYVNLVLVPLFLFSGVFFPLDRYPPAVAAVVRWTPLYQGVALERALVLGDVHWALLGHVVYLLAMAAIGLRVATRRLGRLLLP